MRLTSVLLPGFALLSSVLAHPGDDLTPEIAARREYLGSIKRTDLSHCAEKLKARGVDKRNVERRQAAVENARAKRAIKKRDLTTVLATSHNATSLGYTVKTDPSLLFTGNNSCILSPEVTQGPYYVGGEYIRKDLVEDQEGVGLILDYQVIDTETCEPVPHVYVEIWHCNATGVYSGIVANSNGDLTDAGNINTTFLRGIQLTNRDGVAQFETIFPGHYLSRAPHVHVMVHSPVNETHFCNQTLGNSVLSSHVGQAFFDQDLVAAVESTSPYSINTGALTLNADDGVLQTEVATDGVDPMVEYTLLGDSIEDGLFGWLAFGINKTSTQEIVPSAFYYATGGVLNPDAGPPPGAPPVPDRV